MPDDSHLSGIDPYAAWDREAARLADYLRGRPDDDAEWDVPSECEGWTIRDVLAHLLAEQEYFAACLSGDVANLMQRFGAQGATDLDSFNTIGIALVADRSPSELLAEWIEQDEGNRAGFRARGDSDVDSSIGAYPGPWQAFHLAVRAGHPRRRHPRPRRRRSGRAHGLAGAVLPIRPDRVAPPPERGGDGPRPHAGPRRRHRRRARRRDARRRRRRPQPRPHPRPPQHRRLTERAAARATGPGPRG